MGAQMNDVPVSPPWKTKGPRRGRILRRVVAAAGVAVLVLMTASCGYCDPDNRPLPLVGYTNGKLPAALLMTVSANCQAEERAGADLKKLISDAKAARISMVPGECYRDYATQVYWRNYWCNLGKCQMAAVPGTSNHGWGKAADFDDLDFGTAAFAWMEANAWRYGWNHPGWAQQGKPAAEPWHWEWVGDGGTMYGSLGCSTSGSGSSQDQPEEVTDR